MGSVTAGLNRFTNCLNLISLKGQPLLRISDSPLRLSLSLPPDLPSGISFEVIENEVQGSSGVGVPSRVRVVPGESNVSVFWDDSLLLSATILDRETVHVKLDLRPIGIALFDDHEGLHFGKNILAGNSFSNCVSAIALE